MSESTPSDLFPRAHLHDGAWVWNSNDRAVPADIAATWHTDGLITTRQHDATTTLRERQTHEFLARYRATGAEPTDEERFEMRAAFGEGVTVIDILSGREHHT